MEYIDLSTWKRKEHFEFFRNSDYPQYNISANIDVTNFLSFVRENNLSFYYAMTFASSLVANEIENFRYRIQGDKVVVYDKVHPSLTDITDKDDELYKLITIEMMDDIIEFDKFTKEKSQSQKCYFDWETLNGRDDLLYITCLPWISFTQVNHIIKLEKDDSIPRLTWGKYFKDNNRVLMPFSVQLNHCLADGIHAGIYFKKLQEYIDSI